MSHTRYNVIIIYACSHDIIIIFIISRINIIIFYDIKYTSITRKLIVKLLF